MNLTGRRVLMGTLLAGALGSDAAAQTLVHPAPLTPSGRRNLLNGPSALQAPPRVNDPAGDGAIIGALAGAGVGAAWMTIGYATCDGCDAPARGPMYLAAMSLCAGAGAVAGWVIDRLHSGKAPVVSPIVTKDLTGLTLTMRF